MATSKPQEVDFQAGIAKALLTNSPQAMELAVKYGLTPAEVGTLMQEALFYLEGGPGSCDHPIVATPPPEFLRLSPQELRGMLNGCEGHDRAVTYS